MDRIGIFYGSTSGNTRRVAELIRRELEGETVEVHDVGEANEGDLEQYDMLILGAPTWNEGDLQDDWEAFITHLDGIDLSGKTVALFGLGDQKAYPNAFLDALGTLYEHVKRKGATIVGRWPTHGYTFTRSSAVIDGEFIGLALDEENQPEQTEHRVAKWVKMLRLGLG
ncbi:MAG: flavodoxin [Verrucomicrobia bacterium]|nr:flavodoxin [Verrucomicrobiota bacterium]